MLCRAAEQNPSIFRKEGLLAIDDVIYAYLRFAIQYDNHVINTKYCIQQMLGSQQHIAKGGKFLSTVEMKDLW